MHKQMGVFGRRPGTEEVVCMSEGREGRNLKRREAMKKWKAVLAVFLSIVLVLQSSNIQALADVIDGDGETGREEIVLDKPAETTETSESTDEQKNTPPASEPKKEEPAEPAEPATPEEPAEKKDDSTKKDEPTQTTEPVEKAEETKPAEETEPAQTTEPSKETSSSTADKQSSPETEDTTATLKFDVTGATLTYNQDGEKNVTADTADKTAKVETTQDFKFTVTPDDGQQIASVKAVTSDGVESDVAANDSGEYTLPAANVTDGTTIRVTTEAVPAEEPAEDATPVESEETTETTEDANKSEAATSSNGISTMSISGPSTVAVGKSVELEGGGRYGTWNHGWSAQPQGKVRISADGSSATVKGLDPGEVTITHTYMWGFGSRETETFTLTVIRGLSVTIDDNSIEAGSTTTAHAEGATGSVKWESSNPSVAQVTSNGRVIGVSEGTAQITATDSTGATGSVSVRVTPMMCTITFDLNGGQWSGNDGLKEGANEREFGSQLWSSGDLASPTRDGYYFTGWTPTVSKTVVGNATYRANWERISDLTPVYVYTKVDGTEEDKEGLILNNEGWYTLGVIFVPSWLCDPDAPQNTTVNLNSSYNMGQIESALNEITAYLPNASLLEYIDEIDWTKLHVQNGANDYVPSGPEVRPVSSWHLDGKLDASRLATLTVNYIDSETSDKIITSRQITVGVGTYQSADQYRIEIANYTYDRADPEHVYVTKHGKNEINLYYTRQSASLQYDLNAKSGITGKAPATQRGYIEDSVTVAGADGFSRAGYTFTGWNTEPNGSGTTYLARSQFTFTDQTTTTLYAQWVKTEGMWHSVTYVDGVDGEEIDVPAGSSSVLQGTEYTVSDQEPERTGWTFTGWKTTDVTGSEQTFQAEGTFTMPNKDVTLEAQWEAKSGIAYTVEFYFQDAVDGFFKIDDTLTDTRTGTTDQPVAATDDDKAVSRDNYVFDEANEANVLSDETLNGDGSTKLKVYYKLSLDVAYDLNGGSSDETLSYPGLDWGVDTPKISDPTRAGYTFDGWDPEVDATVTKDATYTAKWEADFSDFSVDGDEWTYNGSSRQITVNGVYAGDKLTYTSSNGEVLATCDVTADGIVNAPEFLNVSDSDTVTVTVTRGGKTASAEATMTITPLTITVTPRDIRKTQGQADPALTSDYSGYLLGETAGWTGALTREPGEAVGTYIISQGSLQLADNPAGNFLAQNYVLVVNEGTFTIVAAPVTPGGGDDPTPTPGGGGDGTPTPGTPATVTPADDTTTDEAAPEEAIDDDTTPLVTPTETIDDGDTPLAAGKHEDCWVHWIILIGMILSAVYFVGVSVRRRKFTSSLLGYENKVLDNDRDNA